MAHSICFSHKEGGDMLQTKCAGLMYSYFSFLTFYTALNTH